MRKQTLAIQLCTLLACLGIGVDSVAESARPPVARVEDFKTTYFGQTVSDPYRWMESMGPDFMAWAHEEDAYTRQALRQIPGYEELVKRTSELSIASDEVRSFELRGDKLLFFLKRPRSSNTFKLCVRPIVGGGEERVLLDPENAAAGSYAAIDYYVPSPDGKYVAYGISPAGSEESVLHVLETATGRILPDHIDRARMADPTWRDDGRSFAYTRLPKSAPDASGPAKEQKNKVFLHTLGADPESDPAIFGYDVSPLAPIAAEDDSFVRFEPHCRFAFGVVLHGVQKELTVYAAPVDAIGKDGTPWRKIIDVPDAVTEFVVRGDELYLRTHHNASRFKIVRTSVSRPDLANAKQIVAPSDAVLRTVRIARDGLYVGALDGNIWTMRRFSFETGQVENVALPFAGTIRELSGHVSSEGVIFKLESLIHPPAVFTVDRKRGAADTHMMSAPRVADYSAIEMEHVKVASRDGTLVPLTIVHKRGMALDGTNPTWLIGYGAYGTIADPGYGPRQLAWWERGGVYAIAHVRGGGEYGEEWHVAGQKLHKQNSVDDFIACARYLIDHKYTSPRHLAAEASSAGGVTVGAAITQQPDLFAAALLRVAVLDALRNETTRFGVANVQEFGTVNVPAEFKALYSVSAYHHVVDGKRYPAVLLAGGVRDLRVPLWQIGKMTARLQAATRNSGKPILLRVEGEGGHGRGSTKDQLDRQFADFYAFLFWQLGAPAFQTTSSPHS